MGQDSMFLWQRPCRPFRGSGALKRSSSSCPSSLFHPLALIASLDLSYPRHSQNANKGLSLSSVLTLWPCLLHILKRNSRMRGPSVGLWLRAGTLQPACFGSDPSLATDHWRHLGGWRMAHHLEPRLSPSSSAEWGYAEHPPCRDSRMVTQAKHAEYLKPAAIITVIKSGQRSVFVDSVFASPLTLRHQ